MLPRTSRDYVADRDLKGGLRCSVFEFCLHMYRGCFAAMHCLAAQISRWYERQRGSAWPHCILVLVAEIEGSLAAELTTSWGCGQRGEAWPPSNLYDVADTDGRCAPCTSWGCRQKRSVMQPSR